MFRRKNYGAKVSTHYRSCILHIKRQGKLAWNGLELGSGFKVELFYQKDVILPGDAIGLNDDFDLTAPLAKFFNLNEAFIPKRLKEVEEVLFNYRRHYRTISRWKSRVMTYGFLSEVYDRPQDVKAFMECEHDLRLRNLIVNNEATLKVMRERLANVSRSETTTWWYIFWVYPITMFILRRITQGT